MQISGINKFSLIEFPSELACVIFTPGCNMRCKFCHNSEFVIPEKLSIILKNLITEEAFFKFLKTRIGKLTGVSICGGEPTLQKDLKEFCKRIKDLGFKVKLDTNGRDSKIIEELINENLVDYVAMDLKHSDDLLEELIGVAVDKGEYNKTISLLLDSNINYEFRTTVIKGIHNIDIIEEIAKKISGANAYYIQNFRKEKTLDPNFSGIPFSEKELEELRIVAKKYINNVGIRA